MYFCLSLIIPGCLDRKNMGLGCEPSANWVFGANQVRTRGFWCGLAAELLRNKIHCCGTGNTLNLTAAAIQSLVCACVHCLLHRVCEKNFRMGQRIENSTCCFELGENQLDARG